MQKTSEVKFARCASSGNITPEGMFFLCDGDALPESLHHINIVLKQSGEARAGELLALGAARVLLADAALLDSTVIARLSQQHGAERIGVYLPARKMGVSWTLETVSNEDFNCLTPSYGKAAWEVLLNDGTGTGTDVEWWLEEMFKLGASAALIAIDMQDDDLNISAGLVENNGDKLWFTPLHQTDTNLEPWVRYGQVRQLLLPELPKYDEAERQRIAESVAVETAQELAEEEQEVTE